MCADDNLNLLSCVSYLQALAKGVHTVMIKVAIRLISVFWSIVVCGDPLRLTHRSQDGSPEHKRGVAICYSRLEQLEPMAS